MQTIWGRIFFSTSEIQTETPLTDCFKSLSLTWKRLSLCERPHRWSLGYCGETSCKRSPCARPPNVQWTRCMLRGEVPASKQLIPDLTDVTTDVITTVNRIKTQHVKAFWYCPPCLRAGKWAPSTRLFCFTARPDGCHAGMFYPAPKRWDPPLFGRRG